MKAKPDNLEPWQFEDAKRLLALSENYMRTHKISQLTMLKEVGFSASMFYQFMGGKLNPPQRPLNYDHVYKFAKLFHVHIEEISPTLARRIIEMSVRVGPAVFAAMTDPQVKLIREDDKAAVEKSEKVDKAVAV